jgi:hypothetical protein
MVTRTSLAIAIKMDFKPENESAFLRGLKSFVWLNIDSIVIGRDILSIGNSAAGAVSCPNQVHPKALEQSPNNEASND